MQLLSGGAEFLQTAFLSALVFIIVLLGFNLIYSALRFGG